MLGAEPTPVYFKGKAVPGVMALGRGHYRIIFSIEKGAFILFDALKAAPELSGFLAQHMADEEKDSVSASDVEPHYIFHQLSPASTLPNNNITFGTYSEDGYATVLQANAGKTVANLSSLILTQDERATAARRGLAELSAESLALFVAVVTGGASVPVQLQLASGAAATTINGIGVYMDALDRQDSDRRIDRQKAAYDERLGKRLLAFDLLLPLLTKLIGAKTNEDLVDVFSDMVGAVVGTAADGVSARTKNQMTAQAGDFVVDPSALQALGQMGEQPPES